VAGDGWVRPHSVVGTWNQGTPLPLTFSRDTFVAASKPSPVDGFWLGTLKARGQSLRIQLTVKSDRAGQESCALDSLDQGAYGLTCTGLGWSGSDLSFDVPPVDGHWRGRLSGRRPGIVRHLDSGRAGCR